MSLTNVFFNCVDVQTDNLGEEVYTAAYSRFGVMFFEDSVVAFRNINKSLIPGASLSFVCWQSPAVNPWQSYSSKKLKNLLIYPLPPQEALDHSHLWNQSMYLQFLRKVIFKI